MAARAPAGALAQTRRVIHAADQNGPALDFLDMAFQTQVRVAFSQHLGIDAAVRRVAARAAVAHRLVFKHKQPFLRLMALRAVFLL